MLDPAAAEEENRCVSPRTFRPKQTKTLNLEDATRLLAAALSPLIVLLLTSALLAASNPVPFVNQPLVPATVVPGSAGFTLTVNGTGFVSGSTVNWNGSPRTTTFVSSSQLTASILATDVAAAGTATVAVTNPAPGGGVSNLAYLGVTNSFRQITFTSATFATASEPVWAISADFNGDGKMDLATADAFDAISVLIGNGDGTFQPFVEYSPGPPGQSPDCITVADLNQDRKPDLIELNGYSGMISVLLGNGDGTFQAAVQYSTAGETPAALALGDFNGDGKLDVAVTNSNDSSISILLGNGDGSLQSPTKVPTSFNPTYIVAGDFNGDDKLDLAIIANGSVSVFLGNGDGTFQTSKPYTAGIGVIHLQTADFNGDGKLDLVVINDESVGATVSVLLGKGDGTFGSPTAFAVGSQPVSLAIADIDGDGKLDLVVSNGDQSALSISLLFGNGDGTFQPQTVYSIGLYGPVVTADFNNDGRQDLAVGNRGYGGLDVLMQIPSVNVAPTSLSFGNQTVGMKSSAQTVTLTNASNSLLQISSIMVTGTNPGDFTQTNTCPATLNAGADCTISVAFTPPVVGSRSATLTVNDSGAPSTQTVALSGTGIGPVVNLSASSVRFGNQVVGTTSGPQSVTLTNTGTISLTVSSITATGDFSQTNNCGNSVVVGGSCTITVRFTATTIGVRTGQIKITDNAGPPTQKISLSGTGTDVSLSTTSLTFAPQKVGTTSPPSSVRLTNVGTSSLTISGFSLTGPNAKDFAQSNNCGTTLRAGGSCSLSVTFTPGAKGTRIATLNISDNGGGSPQTVALTGTGQ